jgi:PRC-barrel domain protein
MATMAQFTIGVDVSCTDGLCGELRRVIVDPVAEAVTHIVVEPGPGDGESRLVPLDIVDVTSGEVRLHCTLAQFATLDRAEQAQFIEGTGEFAGYTPGQVSYLPYYGVGGGMGLGLGAGLNPALTGVPPHAVIRDTVPIGEVDIRRGQPVQATDGDIGKVQGLVIERDSRHITHVLLQEGHLWGRKEVAIPISAVAGTRGGIQLTISKQEVQDLPPVEAVTWNIAI